MQPCSHDSSDTLPPLAVSEWQKLAEQHRTVVRQWTAPYRRRLDSRQKNPVYDFLFTYYPFSLGKLEQWHPGYGTSLICDYEPPTRYQTRHYRYEGGVVALDSATLEEKQIKRIKWIHNLLVLTQSRAGNFGCNGMHEWAMVYSGADIRHRESAPLRFSQEKIDHIVETLPIACSHFDAYRFFSPNALKFNKLRPTLDERAQNEQPACLHTNMDLYKWASKCMPWVGSELLWKTFSLALETRELDMRASPYDLREYDYEPVRIETVEGRIEYERLQRAISKKASELRQAIIEVLAKLVSD